jgi:hypothetical protein
MLVPIFWPAPSPETVFDRRVQPEKRLLRRTGSVQESSQQSPKTSQHHLERGCGGQQVFNRDTQVVLPRREQQPDASVASVVSHVGHI